MISRNSTVEKIEKSIILQYQRGVQVWRSQTAERTPIGLEKIIDIFNVSAKGSLGQWSANRPHDIKVGLYQRILFYLQTKKPPSKKYNN